MKGIVLAGGTGSRMWPITQVTSKQLLPIFDKPMVYYPLSTLMLAGIQEILIITTPQDQDSFRNLLGDGTAFGVTFTYEVQPKPEGLAQALIIGESFIRNETCMMILGDNIFHGVGLGSDLARITLRLGARIFTYEVSTPSQYGILTLDKLGNPISIVEKPEKSNSKLAVTGLYVFDSEVSEIAKNVQPSARGELEITSVIEQYMRAGRLEVSQLSRGAAWLDTGTPSSMHDASTYVKVIEERTGLKIGCLEEIAFRNGWLSESQLAKRARDYRNNSYGKYIEEILQDGNF